jgi:hypothetical protein
MPQKSATQSHQSIEAQPFTDWQQPYLASAAALGASWCDFVGERFHAYAHMIDDVSHCQDLNDAWKVQTTFGQQTFKAYSEQAAKVGGLMTEAAKGNGGDIRH